MNLIVILSLVALVAIIAQPMRMAALTANVERNRFVDQELRAFPVALTTHIYKGAAVGINVSGYLVPYTPATLFVGMAYEEIDNTAGANGAASCRVYTKGDFILPIAAFAIGDVGKPVYASTDNDFTLSPSAAGQIGSAIGFEATGYAVVRIEPGLTQNGQLVASSVVVDCQDGETPSEVFMMPGAINKSGAVVALAVASVVEQFAGASQDQGIVTLQDSDGTTLNLTFTAADAGADALNDFIQEAGSADPLVVAASGDAGAIVPAGKGVKAKVTQPTSGAAAAGKMRISALFMLV